MNSIPSRFVNNGGITCYRCGHTYDHLGHDDRPGRCPECASHAVDVVEPITVEEAEGRPYAGDHSHVGISISDAIGRDIYFEFTLDQDRCLMVLEAAWFVEDHVSPDDPGWDEGIVPQCLSEKMNERGYEVVVSPMDSPTRAN